MDITRIDTIEGFGRCLPDLRGDIQILVELQADTAQPVATPSLIAKLFGGWSAEPETRRAA